jgi:di/tricarboxylate transporter
MLLMLTGKHWATTVFNRDLIVVSKDETVPHPAGRWGKWPSVLAFLCLITGILGFMELFVAAIAALFILAVAGVVTSSVIRSAMDAELLLVLVCSLAIGTAIDVSGLAELLVGGVFRLMEAYPPVVLLATLFFVTVLLTSLITNAAAVSIMFPIALTMGEVTGTNPKAYFVTIAFAASASFITPIGYQTNMMILGPGNYRFADFVRAGLPLTMLYASVCIFFIYKMYL